jgi:hypothetical protein
LRSHSGLTRLTLICLIAFSHSTRVRHGFLGGFFSIRSHKTSRSPNQIQSNSNAKKTSGRCWFLSNKRFWTQPLPTNAVANKEEILFGIPLCEDSESVEFFSFDRTNAASHKIGFPIILILHYQSQLSAFKHTNNKSP